METLSNAAQDVSGQGSQSTLGISKDGEFHLTMNKNVE